MKKDRSKIDGDPEHGRAFGAEHALKTHGFEQIEQERRGTRTTWQRDDGFTTERVDLIKDRWEITRTGQPTIKGQGIGTMVRELGLDADGRLYFPSDFNIDDDGHHQLMNTDLLAAAARGEIDLNAMAKDELASRGMDEWGSWIGFDAAKDRMEGYMTTRSDGRRIWISIPD